MMEVGLWPRQPTFKTVFKALEFFGGEDAADKAAQYLWDMKKQKLKPDKDCYMSVASLFEKRRELQRTVALFKDMQDEGIKVQPSRIAGAYRAAIEQAADEGKAEQAYQMFKEME